MVIKSSLNFNKKLEFQIQPIRLFVSLSILLCNYIYIYIFLIQRKELKCYLRKNIRNKHNFYQSEEKETTKVSPWRATIWMVNTRLIWHQPTVVHAHMLPKSPFFYLNQWHFCLQIPLSCFMSQLIIDLLH